jgi:hypothetical protein
MQARAKYERELKELDAQDEEEDALEIIGEDGDAVPEQVTTKEAEPKNAGEDMDVDETQDTPKEKKGKGKSKKRKSTDGRQAAG